jgi:adenylate cyclase
LETRLEATNTMRYYPLTQSVTSIGRDSSNQIVVDTHFADTDSISRWHAKIARAGDRFVIKDLGSANGLFVNGRRSRENVLQDGAVLGIGTVQFTFRLNQPGSRS